MKTIYNAQIKSTFLGKVSDHNIWSAFIHVEYDRGCQGYGGYRLDETMTTFVICVLDVLDVESWEKLPGKYCRIEVNRDRGKIVRIGHIIEDRWFSMEEEEA